MATRKKLLRACAIERLSASSDASKRAERCLSFGWTSSFAIAWRQELESALKDTRDKLASVVASRSWERLFGPFPPCLLFLGATLLSVVAPASVARGEDSVKRNILRDCPTALEQARALSSEERKELLPYLTLVLRMQLSAMGDVLPAPPLPTPHSTPHPSVPRPPLDAAREGFPGTYLWQTFEPERESEAKRCAVTILREFGALSVDTVPDLIALTEDRSTPDDLRVLVEETARQIAVEAGRDSSFVVAPSVVDQLVRSLSGETAPYALNILIELKRTALPILLHEMKKPDLARREVIFQALLQIDSDGQEIGVELIRLLDSPDETLRVRSLRMIGKLPLLHQEALPNVILRLSDYSPDVQRVAGQTLQKIVSGALPPPREPLSAEVTAALLTGLNGSSPLLREAIFRVILISAPKTEPLSSALKELSRSSDDDIRAHALAARLSLEQNPSTRFSQLVDTLYDSALPIRLDALRALCNSKERPGEVLSNITRLLKADSVKNTPTLKREIFLEVARCAPALGAPASLLPYLMETLSYDERPHPGTEALALYGSKATTSLFRELKSSDPTTRSNVAAALGALRPTPRTVLEALCPLLRDPYAPVVSATQKALISIGSPALRCAERSERDPHSRFASQVVLHRIAPFDSERGELLSTALKQAPCASRFEIAPLLAAPTLQNRIDVAEALLSCSSETERITALEVLLQIAPLTPSDSAAVLSALKGESIPPGGKIRILKHANSLPLPSEESTNILLALLKSDDNSLRSKILSELLRRPPLPDGADSELKTIALDEKEETIIRFDAAAAATHLTPQTFPTEEFFREELEDENFNWALLSLRKLRANSALPILLSAVSDAEEERQPLILETIASFGDEASTAVEALLPLTTTLHAPTRRAAVSALVSITPKAPESKTLFRKELNSLGALRLLSTTVPPEFAPSLEEFISNPSSTVELVISKALLKKLKDRPSDVSPQSRGEEPLSPPTSSEREKREAPAE